MPTGAFNICCPRDCVSRHNGDTSGAPLNPFFPTVPTFAVRETVSVSIRGAPRVPPLNPSETIVHSPLGVQQRGALHLHLAHPRGARHLPLLQLHQVVRRLAAREFNPFMPTVAFNICCPRDCVSQTAHVGTVGKNGLIDPM